MNKSNDRMLWLSMLNRTKSLYDFNASNLYLLYVRRVDACSSFWPRIHFQTMCQVNRCTIITTTNVRLSFFIFRHWYPAKKSSIVRLSCSPLFGSIYFARLFIPFGWFTILQYFSLSALSMSYAKVMNRRAIVVVAFPSHSSHTHTHFIFYSNRIFHLIRYKMFISACFLPFIFLVSFVCLLAHSANMLTLTTCENGENFVLSSVGTALVVRLVYFNKTSPAYQHHSTNSYDRDDASEKKNLSFTLSQPECEWKKNLWRN